MGRCSDDAIGGWTVILAVDTSGPRAVVAVGSSDGVLLAGGVGERPRSHAEDIAGLVAAASRGHDITHVAVGRGPGSFAGLRVGLAFAQVYAWARGLPVTGLCSLDVVAEQEDLVDGWVVMDARRGEVFAAPYTARRRSGDPVVRARGTAWEGPPELTVVGDVELLGTADRRAVGVTVLSTAALARVAARTVREDPAASIQPDYIRRPDVTLSQGARSTP